MTAKPKAREKEQQEAEEIREEIYGIADRSPKAPKWITTDKKPSCPGIPCTIWSDIHYGETIKKDEVAGCNEFNPHIAERRIKTLAENTVDIAFNHMGKSKTTYPGIVVMLGGDMVSGGIHEELLLTDDKTVVEQTLELVEYLIAAINIIKGKFGRIFLPCVVGNHGRSTLKPRHKGRVHTSFDWHIYCHLERHFRGDPNIQFFIPNESDAYFEVYGHRFLLTHGDSLGVRGGDGIVGAVGPIMRGAYKLGRSEGQIGRDFDTVVMGHWHQYITLPGIIVNNSLKGYDEYARLHLRAPYSRPSQALWFVHPEQGITCHYQIYLEPLRKSNQTTRVLTWRE